LSNTFYKKMAILLPVYNEAPSIKALLTDISNYGIKTLVVDDGSVDGSTTILKEIGTDAIYFEKNRGKGYALRKGFKRLLSEGYDWILIMDADGQHLPEEIDKFVNKAMSTDCDLISGNRLDNPEGMPPIRILANKFMSWLVGKIAGVEVKDCQCGYKFLSANFLRQAKLSADHFEIEDDLLMEAIRLKCKIGYVSIKTVYKDEVSHINPILDTIRFFSYLFKSKRS
jgi:glycosyltransferase involved in cell wall biosynthesis